MFQRVSCERCWYSKIQLRFSRVPHSRKNHSFAQPNAPVCAICQHVDNQPHILPQAFLEVVDHSKPWQASDHLARIPWASSRETNNLVNLPRMTRSKSSSASCSASLHQMVVSVLIPRDRTGCSIKALPYIMDSSTSAVALIDWKEGARRMCRMNNPQEPSVTTWVPIHKGRSPA